MSALSQQRILSSPQVRVWLKRALKLAILLLVVWAAWGTLKAGVADLDKHSWQLNPWWLVAAGGLYLLSLLPAGLFWHLVLRAMGQSPRVGESLRAYYIGHLGKYVPGKALVVILRAGLVQSHRVDPVVAAVAVFYETATMMAVGASLAAAILAFSAGGHGTLLLVSLGLIVAMGVPTLPPVFLTLARLTGVGRKDPEKTKRLAGLNYATLAVGWVAMSLGWIVMALSLGAVLRAMGLGAGLSAERLPLLVAAVSLAVVAGFLSMIPGGAVVRELVLTQLVAADFGSVAALVAPVVLRLVWLVAEAVISGILYVAGPKPRTLPADSPGASGPLPPATDSAASDRKG